MPDTATALDLIAQGLLSELPSALITAAVTALAVWAVRRYRKGGDGGDGTGRL
ncbi:hypothetical protein [Streptomyces aureus]|uniref:hypothetical protein n=1 Tax=Streptomyces aureus TaxID=193461 RepID=UPI000A6CA167|nr:hypothetical protein [Streptomyces aureus]